MKILNWTEVKLEPKKFRLPGWILHRWISCLVKLLLYNLLGSFSPPFAGVIFFSEQKIFFYNSAVLFAVFRVRYCTLPWFTRSWWFTISWLWFVAVFVGGCPRRLESFFTIRLRAVFWGLIEVIQVTVLFFPSRVPFAWLLQFWGWVVSGWIVF